MRCLEEFDDNFFLGVEMSSGIMDNDSVFEDVDQSTSPKCRKEAGLQSNGPTITPKRTRTLSTAMGSEDAKSHQEHVTPKPNRFVLRRQNTEIIIRELPTSLGRKISSMPGIPMTPQHKRTNTFSEDGITDIMNPHDEGENSHDASTLLSALYALHMVIMSFVLTTSHFITEGITLFALDIYYLLIYMISVTWMISFQSIATSCNRRSSDFGYAKFSHVTNRWLKGVICVFGLAIIIKDVLEFIEYFQYSEDCTVSNGVRLATPLVQAVFAMTQVNFLFKYSKVCVHDKRSLSRFGSIHVVATNLSVWLFLITNESVHSLDMVKGDHNSSDALCLGDNLYTTPMSTASPHHYIATTENKTIMKSMKYYDAGSGKASSEVSDLTCGCTSDLCDAISSAATFLYPFVIEFSLVASCMMYIVWKNIGTIPKSVQMIIRPSYKFYGSYKGIIAGLGVLVATVVEIVVLGTQTSGVSEDNKTYCSELTNLKIHNTFLVLLGILSIAAMIICFVLFMKDKRRIEIKEHVSLDLVLLFVTISGSIAINFFYILAVYLSMAHENTFIWGAIYPVVDLFQGAIQVVFILVGLYREPKTAEDPQDTTQEIDETLRDSQMNGEDLGSTLFTRLQSRSTFREMGPAYRTSGLPSYSSNVFENTTALNTISERLPSSSDSYMKLRLDENQNEDNISCSSSEPDKVSSPNTSGIGSEEEPVYHQTKSKIKKRRERKATEITTESSPGVVVIAKMKVSPPDSLRLKIRDLLMFLLCTNACMWIFWSLDGTAFYLYSWPLQYYEGTTWMTIISICEPLSIFFRMHSAACLFEIWSFA